MNRPLLWISTTMIAAVVAVAAAAPPNLPQALAAQEKLARERPGDAAVANDLGNLLRLAGRLGEAEEAYQRALTNDPGRVSARFNLALLLQQQGRFDEALAHYRQVVAAQPDHAWAHYQRGAILESKGSTTAAIEAYARAFALDLQLSFPSINPHVIENKLVTEALILSQRQAEAIPQAPNAYEDPARIAALLLPSASSARDGERFAETAAPEADPSAGAAPAPSGRQEPARVGSARPQKSLSHDDLEPGSNLGQAVPQGAGGRSGGARSPTRPGGFAVPGYVPGQDPQGRGVQTPPPSRLPDRGGVVAPLPPGQRTPGGSRFRPGTPSTGRLDIEVVPAPAVPPGERAG